MVRLRVGVILLTVITGAVSLLSPGTGEAPPSPDYLALPDTKTSPKPDGVTPSPPQGGFLLPALSAPRSSLLPLASSNPALLPRGAVFAPLAPIITAPVNTALVPNLAAPVNALSPATTSASQQPQQLQPQLSPPGGLITSSLLPYTPHPAGSVSPRAKMYYLPPGAAPFNPVPSPGRQPLPVGPFLTPGAAPLFSPPGQYPARSVPPRANMYYLPPGAAQLNPVRSPGRQTLPVGPFLPPGAAPPLPPPGQQYPYSWIAPSSIPPQYGRPIPQAAGSPSPIQNSLTNTNPAPSGKGNVILPLNWQQPLHSPANQIQAQFAAAVRSNPPRPAVVLGRRNRSPFFSPSPAKPSNIMQIIDFLGRIRATKELDCKTVSEALSMNLPKFYPLSCDDKCPPSSVCRNVGPFGFCCPPLVTDKLIWMVGLAERFKVLGG